MRSGEANSHCPRAPTSGVASTRSAGTSRRVTFEVMGFAVCLSNRILAFVLDPPPYTYRIASHLGHVADYSHERYKGGSSKPLPGRQAMSKRSQPLPGALAIHRDPHNEAQPAQPARIKAKERMPQ